MKRFYASIVVAMLAMASFAQQSDLFPYPNMPDSLRSPEKRMEYLLQHYWDRYNFADPTIAAKTEYNEQGFVNFIDLLPRVKPAIAADAMRTFVDRMYSACKPQREALANLADQYLGDNESPVHNDMLYAMYLELTASSKFASAAERTRNEYMARNLRKNLPGTVAADFDYITHDGAKHTMHKFEARFTLLYFYDPDCQHCRDTAAKLADMEPQFKNKGIKVLAIYPYEETERWLNINPPFPNSWTDGCSPQGKIINDDTYYFKSMPSLYLLDDEKRVILKNPSVEVLESNSL